MHEYGNFNISIEIDRKSSKYPFEIADFLEMVSHDFFIFIKLQYGVIFPPGSKELVPNLARESLGVNCGTAAALEKGTKFLTLKSRKFGHFPSVVV